MGTLTQEVLLPICLVPVCLVPGGHTEGGFLAHEPSPAGWVPVGHGFGAHAVPSLTGCVPGGQGSPQWLLPSLLNRWVLVGHGMGRQGPSPLTRSVLGGHGSTAQSIPLLARWVPGLQGGTPQGLSPSPVAWASPEHGIGTQVVSPPSIR